MKGFIVERIEDKKIEKHINRAEIPIGKMEINVIEEKKNKLIFELKGASHTLCNALKAEMHNDNNVKIATYSIRHPLVGQPKFIIETDGTDPEKALISAAERLKKVNDKFEKDFTKEV